MTFDEANYFIQSRQNNRDGIAADLAERPAENPGALLLLRQSCG